MRRGIRWVLGLTALLQLLSMPAFAHQPASSYLLIQAAADNSSAESSELVFNTEWRVNIRDVVAALSLEPSGARLDSDADGQLVWSELAAAEPAITDFRDRHLTMATGGGACRVIKRAGAQSVRQAGTQPEMALKQQYDGLYLSLMFSMACPGNTENESLSVSSSAFFDQDNLHRTIVTHSGADWPLDQRIISPENREVSFSSQPHGIWSTFTRFVQQGMWHIAIGLDHVLFVVALLLTVVFVRKGHTWVPAQSARTVMIQTLKLVTAFTLAHSITLTLSVLGFISVSAVWVEAIIALSIAVMALNNLWPVLGDRLWTLTFGFGLIHGLGFASVLMDLGLPPGARAAALLAFNVGVEIGQLVIVLVLLPILLMARTAPDYRRLIMPGLSLIIAALALYWLGQRTGLL